MCSNHMVVRFFWTFFRLSPKGFFFLTASIHLQGITRILIRTAIIIYHSRFIFLQLSDTRNHVKDRNKIIQWLQRDKYNP